jgi:acetyl-CoA synthetase (ADP-forming)
MPLYDQKRSKALLRRYRIPFCESKVCSSQSELLAFAKRVGYPVVLKVESEAVVHKSDSGGVIAGIMDSKALIGSQKKIIRNISERFPDLSGFSFLVQKQVTGKEVIIGMKRDPQFGPVIMVGLGGIFVEVLKDVSFRIAPLKKSDAKAMLAELKSYRILTGVRGEPSVDIDSLVDMILKISRMSLGEDAIEEIDFNPVMVNEKKAYVVDARIIGGQD